MRRDAVCLLHRRRVERDADDDRATVAFGQQPGNIAANAAASCRGVMIAGMSLPPAS